MFGSAALVILQLSFSLCDNIHSVVLLFICVELSNTLPAAAAQWNHQSARHSPKRGSTVEVHHKLNSVYNETILISWWWWSYVKGGVRGWGKKRHKCAKVARESRWLHVIITTAHNPINFSKPRVSRIFTICSRFSEKSIGSLFYKCSSNEINSNDSKVEDEQENPELLLFKRFTHRIGKSRALNWILNHRGNK